MVNLIQKFKDAVGLTNPTEEELASSGNKRKVYIYIKDNITNIEIDWR